MKKFITKQLTMKFALRFLRVFFKYAPFPERKKLWDVLTGLRGPDNQDVNDPLTNFDVELYKKATTAVIRYNFLREAADNSGAFAITKADKDKYAEARRFMTGNKKIAPPHFVKHAQRAFEALGLSWSNSNND